MEKEKPMKQFLFSLTVLASILSVGVLGVIIMGVTSFGGRTDSYSNTITVSGEAEVFAVPDIAKISFSVTETEKTQDAAQVKVTEKTAEILASLEKLSIAEKDIKTTNYSIYPKYEYTADGKYNRKQELVGYTVSQSIALTVRDLEKAGDVVTTLGGAQVENLWGPNFEIDDRSGLELEAKQLAIQEAKAKAKVLAKELDVRLGKVVSFGEDGYMPMPYARADFTEEMAFDMVASSAPQKAALPQGENRIFSRVTVTYKIK